MLTHLLRTRGTVGRGGDCMKHNRKYLVRPHRRKIPLLPKDAQDARLSLQEACSVFLLWVWSSGPRAPVQARGYLLSFQFITHRCQEAAINARHPLVIDCSNVPNGDFPGTTRPAPPRPRVVRRGVQGGTTPSTRETNRSVPEQYNSPPNPFFSTSCASEQTKQARHLDDDSYMRA